MSAPVVNRITAVLIMERIEPALDFWTKLGYTITAEVPAESGLGFAILTQGSTEVMYQTRQSVANDVPQLALSGASTHLFVEVTDLDAVERALAGAPVFLPRRQTFYGSTETGFVEPGGHHVTFAQFIR